MTFAQRNKIAAPAVGLIIYQTDGLSGLYHYTSTGWLNLNASATISYLQLISKNNNQGYRLYGRDVVQQNIIGSEAVDLSSSIAGGSANTYGATGDYSLAAGLNVKASGQFAFTQGSNTVASAYGSVALGNTSTATGNMSFAMGNRSNATNLHAFAFGEKANATGTNSVAIGSNAVASGNNAIALGNTNKATATNTVALGANTTASGNYATSLGQKTTASGIHSLATGNSTTALGATSVAMGHTTTASGATSVAMGSATTASGGTSIAMGNSTTASGTNSVALGFASMASGDYSIVGGNFATASGAGAIVFGTSSTASGAGAIALGNQLTTKSFSEVGVGLFNTNYTPASTTAHHANDRAFVVGIGNADNARKDGLIVYKNGTLKLNKLTAQPTDTVDRLYVQNNHLVYNGARLETSQLERITENNKVGHRLYNRNAANYGNIGTNAVDLSASTTVSNTKGATGDYATAFGNETTASGNTAIAMGNSTIASGATSVAMGHTTTASGVTSVAMGSATTASGNTAIAMGNSTTASGTNSIALGFASTASSDYAIVGGNLSTASGIGSVAFGSFSMASGQGAVALGSSADASGKTAMALGNTVTAKSYGEITIGTFNTDYTPMSATIHNLNDRAFIVGIGSDYDDRKDGLIVYKDGTLKLNKFTTVPTLVTDRLYIYNNKVNYNGQRLETSQLEKLTENGQTGYRLFEKSAANHGNIGLNAIDLSTSASASTTKGATGNYAIALGQETTASGNNAIVSGINSIASGNNSVALGNNVIASNTNTIALGTNTLSSGVNTVSIGNNVTAKSFNEIVIGANNTDYTPVSNSSYNSSDRAFIIGVGSDAANKKDGLIVYKDGTVALSNFAATPTTTTNRLYVLNNQVMYNGAMIGEASQLAKLTQNGNTGYRLLGANGANYGPIGANAVDLSQSTVASTTHGATGVKSFAFGTNNKASGDYSTSFGYSNTASGLTSMTFGSGNSATAINATAIGQFTTASGGASIAMGNGTTASAYTATAMGNGSIASGTSSTAMGDLTNAKSYAETAVGSYNTNYTPADATAHNSADRAFVVGIGSSEAARKDGLVIFKNGTAVFGNGTSSPKGKVYIENGFTSTNYAPFAHYANWDGTVATGMYTGNAPVEVSLYTEGRIFAVEFDAFSDKRIKNIIGLSNAQHDLNTISQIRITDYTMKDQVQYGSKTFKKVIAQELKTVYPRAVSLSTNFIPNIYQKAMVKEGWIDLKVDVVKGDKLKLMTLSGSKEVVVETVETNRFKIDWLTDSEVFIYGKEVNDFHTVDYEALTTLNISATQALLEEIKQLKAQNAALKSDVGSLQQLKAEMQQIKSLLQANMISGK